MEKMDYAGVIAECNQSILIRASVLMVEVPIGSVTLDVGELAVLDDEVVYCRSLFQDAKIIIPLTFHNFNCLKVIDYVEFWFSGDITKPRLHLILQHF